MVLRNIKMWIFLGRYAMFWFAVIFIRIDEVTPRRAFLCIFRVCKKTCQYINTVWGLQTTREKFSARTKSSRPGRLSGRRPPSQTAGPWGSHRPCGRRCPAGPARGSGGEVAPPGGIPLGSAHMPTQHTVTSRGRIPQTDMAVAALSGTLGL